MIQRFPIPPFTLETALEKVQLAENAWNSKDPELVSKAYTPDSEWRNRTQFINGRAEIVTFLSLKNGRKNINTKSKKNFGDFMETAWLFDLNTNTETKKGNGFALMETKIRSEEHTSELQSQFH